MAVEIKIDPVPIEQFWDKMRRFEKQLPFASSVAINKTAELVRTKEVSNIQDKFTTRKPWFKPRTRFGVNLKPSNKRNLVASIFSRAPWLKIQEEGGTKRHRTSTPGAGKSLVLVPAKEIRSTKSRLIPKRLSPAKLLKDPKKNKVFWVNTPKGRMLVQRKGKGKNSKTRVLFFGFGSTNIKAILDYEKTGKAIVDKNYEREFTRALFFAARSDGVLIRSNKGGQ